MTEGPATATANVNATLTPMAMSPAVPLARADILGPAGPKDPAGPARSGRLVIAGWRAPWRRR